MAGAAAPPPPPQPQQPAGAARTARSPAPIHTSSPPAYPAAAVRRPPRVPWPLRAAATLLRGHARLPLPHAQGGGGGSAGAGHQRRWDTEAAGISALCVEMHVNRHPTSQPRHCTCSDLHRCTAAQAGILSQLIVLAPTSSPRSSSPRHLQGRSSTGRRSGAASTSYPPPTWQRLSTRPRLVGQYRASSASRSAGRAGAACRRASEWVGGRIVTMRPWTETEAMQEPGPAGQPTDATGA